MKRILPAVSIATCGLSLAGLALAQAVALPPAKAPGEQLQRVPVSGLHIGEPGHMKNPYEGDKNAWLEGQKLFKSLNCAGCHAPGGGGGMGPPLSDKVWIYGNDPGDIYLTIEHGRPNGMPQWGTALPPQAIWALVTYVETLSTPENPVLGGRTPQASQPAPGAEPVPPKPASAKQPPPVPKQEKPAPQTPKSPHPAPPTHPKPPSTSGGRS